MLLGLCWVWCGDGMVRGGMRMGMGWRWVWDGDGMETEVGMGWGWKWGWDLDEDGMGTGMGGVEMRMQCRLCIPDGGGRCVVLTPSGVSLLHTPYQCQHEALYKYCITLSRLFFMLDHYLVYGIL